MRINTPQSTPEKSGIFLQQKIFLWSILADLEYGGLELVFIG